MIYKMTIHKPGEAIGQIVQNTYPETKQLQALVAGPDEEHTLIEHVQLNLKDGNKSERPGMIVNENGMSLGLPHNKEATMLYWQTAQNNGNVTSHPILGTAIILDNFKLR